MDDVTLGKLLTEAHREHAVYRNPEGVSVSQSSLSVVFDRTGKPVGERNVDQSIGFGVTRNTYSAHSKFSENTQAEKVVDRTGKPVGESSSNAQIRTLLEAHRQMIIAEYCEKIGHHELQAAGQEDGVPKAGLKQAAADSRGSRTCVCANTFLLRVWHTQGEKDELTSCRGTV